MIDCRRAQFSAQEPIIRLRMICQSWKVMFQAEYSSGQPLRMLVDLRASVDAALGRGSEAEGGEKAAEATATAKAAPSRAVAAKNAARAAGASETSAPADAAPEAPAKPKAKFAVANGDAPEFEVSGTAAEWNQDEDSPGRKK